jgi:hypothetical protein
MYIPELASLESPWSKLRAFRVYRVHAISVLPGAGIRMPMLFTHSTFLDRAMRCMI